MMRAFGLSPCGNSIVARVQGQSIIHLKMFVESGHDVKIKLAYLMVRMAVFIPAGSKERENLCCVSPETKQSPGTGT